MLGGAAWTTPVGLLRLWAASGCGLLAAAYLRDRPDWLGKRPDGSLAGWARGLLLPVRLVLLGLLTLDRHLTDEAPWHQVAPGLFLGRRLAASALPGEVRRVVDLTAEFPSLLPPAGASAPTTLPTLDGMVPPEAAFAALVEDLAAEPRPLYIHCAQGHGRSALLMAAVLVARGLAPDPDEAVRHLRATRPGVGLRAPQARLLERWWRRSRDVSARS